MKCPNCGKKWGYGAERQDKTEWLPGLCQDCFHREFPGLRREKDAETKTLRDEFAMAALSGSLARQNFTPEEMREAGRNSYALADAMLAAREGK